MSELTPIAPVRSAGKLDIGQVIFADGVFSVDMIFTTSSSKISEDDMKSASLAVAQNVKTLMHQNGFWDHGRPEIKVTPLDDRSAHFLVAVRTKAGLPKPMKLILPDANAR